jgi:glutathione S-transferase
MRKTSRRTPMQLYNSYLSNYASKCRIVIYEKNAAVDLARVPGGTTRSIEYGRIYPLAKVPDALVDFQKTGVPR